MKKLFKSILSLSIVLAFVLPAILLVGCSKKYTIDVAVLAGDGQVLLKQASVDSAKSIAGKNSVAEGETFEFLISPNNGWVIKSVKKDGIAVESFDKNGYYESFVDVKADHTVEVEFEKVQYTVTFMCKNDVNADVVYRVEYVVNNETALDLNANIFGGDNNNNWFVYLANGTKMYLCNGKTTIDAVKESDYEVNKLYVRTNWVVYTDKTADQIPVAE